MEGPFVCVPWALVFLNLNPEALVVLMILGVRKSQMPAFRVDEVAAGPGTGQDCGCGSQSVQVEDLRF